MHVASLNKQVAIQQGVFKEKSGKNKSMLQLPETPMASGFNI